MQVPPNSIYQSPQEHPENSETTPLYIQVLQPPNNRNLLIGEIFRSALSDGIPKISIGTGLMCMIVSESIVKYPKCYDSDDICYYGDDNKQMYLDITGTILNAVGMCLISFVPMAYYCVRFARGLPR